jgi:tetratricopeptide (TPR) repeat protein
MFQPSREGSSVLPVLSQLPLPIDTRAYRQAQREKRCAELSIEAYEDSPRCHDSFWHPIGLTGKKATLAAIAVMEGDTAFIAFRGTHNRRNHLSNFNTFPTGSPPRHRGFVKCWTNLRTQVENWLLQHKPLVVVLTGHSLGAAIAQLGAYELAAQGYRVASVICFGAPIVGWQSFAAEYNKSPIAGTSALTLKDVTTNYVFRSDLVPYLQFSGKFRQIGRTLSIDGQGFRSNDDLPWLVDAMNSTQRRLLGPTGNNPEFEGRSAPLGTKKSENFTTSSAAFLDAAVTRPPNVDLQSLIDKARPFARPIVNANVHAQMVVLALAALLTAVFSIKYFRRDFRYHSKDGYGRAMSERVSRWHPLAYAERGHQLMINQKPADAVDYFSTAIQLAGKDANLSGLLSETSHLMNGRLYISRADAHSKLGNFAAAIVDLGVFITASSSSATLGTSGDNTTEYLLLKALEARVVAFENAGDFRSAMADCEAILALKLKLDYQVYSSVSDEAWNAVGVSNSAGKGLAMLFGLQKKQQGAIEHLLQQREAAFNKAMAATWEWARIRRAVCAYQLKDFAVAIAECSTVIEANVKNSGAFQVRASALNEIGQSDLALTDITKAIELDPENPAYVYSRAHLRARPSFEKMERDIGSDEPIVWIRLKTRLADLPLIEQDLRKTLELDESHVKAKVLLQALTQLKP